MELLNRYSFVIIGLLVITLLAFVSWTFLGRKPAISISLVTITILVVFQFVMSTSSDKYVTVQDFNETVLNGRPTFLMLYSNL